jgi:F0F1-type ATP synthase assembly protein I
MTFALSDGIMEVSSENLKITDKAKKDRLLLLISSVSSILLSLILIYKWPITGDLYYLVVGCIVLLPNIALLWKWYKEFRFVENIIKFSDIVKFKMINIKLSGTRVGLIQMKNNKFRRIKMEYKDLLELRKFMEANNIQVTP